jgi:YVTN family beta-propeller protein
VLAAPYAYIAQINLGTLSVIDTVKNKKVTTINVGGAPFALTMSPDGRTAYVARTTYPPMEGWISVIDVLTHSVTDTIAVGNSPQGAAVLPNGTKLYVTDCGDAPGITIINTYSNTTEKTIPFGRCPFGVAAHPDGSKVYFTDWSDDLVARIDTVSETVDMTTVTVGRLPIGIAVRPYSSEAYVTNWAGQSISVIDTSSNSVIDTISLAPESPNYLAFNTSGTSAYVTNDGGTNVWVIDTGSRTVISTINVGAQSYGIDVTPDGAYVYVAVCGYDDDKEKEINCGVRVIETATNAVKKKIKLSGQPYSMGKFIGGPQFLMTVSTAGLGTGKVISKKLPDIDCGSGGIKCEADFYVNRKVQLQAVPDEGSVLTGWSGACTKKSKTCKLVITDDYSVTATFEPK